MNGTYYQNPTFPSATLPNNEDTYIKVEKRVSINTTYIEDLLKNNVGKKKCIC